jgi:hypothetical protein
MNNPKRKTVRNKMALLDRFTPRMAAFGFLVMGIAILILGYRYQHPEGLSWNALTSDLYANVGVDFVSIAITVLVIDALNQRREVRMEKRRLIREMGSRDNGIALRAVQELREYSYLSDGSLRSVWLMSANLEGAELYSADIRGAALHSANLRGAELVGANLSRAALWRTNLADAGLIYADLSGANFKYANLECARVTHNQLEKSYSLRGTVLPNGKVYDGSFQLKGDIDEAKQDGIDISDPVALAKWYAVPWEEFRRSMDLRKERPEFTDWGRH